MEIDTGNTAWVLASAALVLLMTPGLAFFYGGMVRSKNVLGMLMQNFACMAVVGVLWVLFVYSIAFGADAGNGLFGDLHQWGLRNIKEPVAGYDGALAQSIPPIVFVAFQLMFAIITPALMTGSIADRVKFGAFVLFVGLWIALVYGPIAHWVFSPEGWLFQRGALDFAGGTVVHANAGAAGLAMCLVLGRRLGWPKEQMRPHNVPFVLLGAGLLWFGWFGFNAGSALGANALAGQAFFTTMVATATALLGWLIVERIRDGHYTSLGAASGAVAGLVAITPACAFVTPIGAVGLGLVAGAVCSLAVGLKWKLGFDDSLDVVGVHLVGGLIGALLTGVFASTAINTVAGGPAQLGKQAIAAAVTLVFSFVATLAILKVVDSLVGVRVTEEEEEEGLDLSQHGESAYGHGEPSTAVPALTENDIDRLVKELMKAARTGTEDDGAVVIPSMQRSEGAPID